MRLFRKTIELDEKGMNEFITSVSEDNAPRYKKREELKSNVESGSYWDTLAAEREKGLADRPMSDNYDLDDEDYVNTMDSMEDSGLSPEDEEIEAAASLATMSLHENEAEQRRAISEEFKNAFKLHGEETKFDRSFPNVPDDDESVRERKERAESLPDDDDPLDFLDAIGPKTKDENSNDREAVIERETSRENAKEETDNKRKEQPEKRKESKDKDKKESKPKREGLFTRRRSASSFKDEEVGAGKGSRALRDLVVAKCDAVQDGRLQLNILRTEYQEVTAYLQDTQLIERLDAAEKGELSEAGRHILAIKKEMERTSRKRRKLTDYQISILERYEEVVPSDIKKIEEDEEYHNLIKEDLSKLEGEKNDIIFERDNAEDKLVFLKKLGIVSTIVIIALLVLYMGLFIATERKINIMPEFLITVACAIILVTYIFIENRRSVFAIKMSDKKMNRLITLQNKIKIKYVNSANTIDFLYDKYAINSSGELKYRWEQYVAMRDEMNLQKKNIEILDMYEREIENYMKQLGVHDPEVWTYQASALVDPREMVELKHRLNTRRGKLRDSIHPKKR